MSVSRCGTSDKSNSIKLNFSKNNIDITANTPEVGEAKESLPVVYKGREFSIAFNPEFLMAPLRNLTRVEVFGSPRVDWVRVRAVDTGGRVTFAFSPGR